MAFAAFGNERPTARITRLFFGQKSASRIFPAMGVGLRQAFRERQRSSRVSIVPSASRKRKNFRSAIEWVPHSDLIHANYTLLACA
jgi:hypothetical protein